MNPQKQREGSYGPASGPRQYGGSYGYGYGSYPGYGYGGYPAGGENAVQRTVQDYLLVLRERIWYIGVVFSVVFACALLYTVTRTPIYQSASTVQIFRRGPTVMRVEQVMDSEVRSAEDLNTQVNILKSDTIVDRVAARLTGEDKRKFLAPYWKFGAPAPRMESILSRNRDVVPQRLSLIIALQYKHPDKEIAAKVANLFADEYITYNAHVQADESLKAVEELEQRAEEQRKKVDEIANALQAYREKNNLVSLDQRKDIVTEKLKTLNTYVTQGSNALQEAETRWKQVQALRDGGGDLLNLPFVASVPAVSQLQQQVAAAKITVGQFSQRYRPKHPKMIEAMDTLSAAEQQLQKAIETSIAQVQADYQSAVQNYGKARQALAAQETDSLALDRFGVEYTNLERDYEVNEKLLEQILERMRETSVSGTIETQNARIVDRAQPGNRPISPDYLVNLALGLVGGMGLGLACAFFVAYIDDRVKSTFDIEGVVGLPLLGVIPEIKGLGQVEDMSTSVAKKADREVAEPFATLYSSLQLKDQSKAAQCFLVTSTVASEGKSFITTTLASTYGSHGERVVVVDCDLRRPSVHRVFHLENLKGVIDVCSGEAKLDDVIVKGVRPNVDVIPTGGRAKNPTQTLNSKEFATLISDLRKRYDRVFVDTPPLAPVSDALVVLPLVDGSLYAIYFNKVRRKAAQFCAHRLTDANVPNFGAILNGLDLEVGGMYYAQYGKSYRDYYAGMGANGADAPGAEAKHGRSRGKI